MLNWLVHHVTSRLYKVNPLNAELNPICHLLALLGAHLILHVGKIRVNVDLPTAETGYLNYGFCGQPSRQAYAAIMQQAAVKTDSTSLAIIVSMGAVRPVCW